MLASAPTDVLTLELTDFMVELKEGAIEHVGTKTKAATVKLYHVTAAGARAFGDSQVKLEFADEEGNEVTVALGASAAAALAADLDAVGEELASGED